MHGLCLPVFLFQLSLQFKIESSLVLLGLFPSLILLVSDDAGMHGCFLRSLCPVHESDDTDGANQRGRQCEFRCSRHTSAARKGIEWCVLGRKKCDGSKKMFMRKVHMHINEASEGRCS